MPSSPQKFKKLFIEQSNQNQISQESDACINSIIEKHIALRKKIKNNMFIVSVESNNNVTDVNIISKDMAFIVDSITAEIVHRGLNITSLLHPIIKRDKDENHRAHIHIRTSNKLPAEECSSLQEAMEDILSDVALANQDWVGMQEKVLACLDTLKTAPKKTYPTALIEDNIDFLNYVYNDNFTLLGYREYRLNKQKDGTTKNVTVRKSGLGLLRNERTPIFLNNKDVSLPDHLQDLRASLPPIHVSKINKLSTVHRKVPLDCLTIKIFDKNGELAGEGCFIGLFTSVTYNQSLKTIPFLRHKADCVVESMGFKKGSHDHRVLRHVLEKYPRDELFQISVEQLTSFSSELVQLQDYKRVALFMRDDLFERSVSCLIYVPKDRWDTRLRLKFKSILEKALDGKTADYSLSIDDSSLARLSFVIEVEPFNLKKYDKAAIELELRAAAQSWIDDLRALAYTKMDDDQKAYDLIEKYQDAFSADYQNNVNSNQAFEDIYHIEKTLKTEQLGINLIRQKSDCQTKGDICHLDLKFYNLGNSLDLSALFPIIENMGFYVTAEIPSKVRLPSGDIVWVQHFVLKTNGVVLKDGDFQNRKHLFERCFLAVQRGAIEDDTLNQLTLKEGVSGRDILILRTVLRYLRQTIYTYSKTFTEQVVTHNSKIARLLIESFHASHNPTFKGSRKSAHQRIDAELKHEFDNIKSIDHDNIMRLFKNIIDATLRTNFYQTAFDGSIKDYVSIKLNSAQITSLPDPRPYREIFVYAPETEGVHLRGDAIARGGLRWSDRHEDFRTEVLGLMKAQMVKNAVIVPMGSKGGFVVKNPPTTGGRDAWIAEGIRCYKTFIRGLLDITDNVIDNKIVPPKSVVRLDSDDPYLVVAADKGTATFSDIANGVSEEYGFWLGDAFASGGSAGYDHKVMGITARGAWESVKRHFHELDHNTQTQDFDVMGVGDMGGDVFGNGMLLSKHIRLVGAFNHLHIFCDPTPNSKKTWVERKRLFDDVMGWDQYNTKLLSAGGRIYSRQDKVLKLTKQIKQRFGLDKDEVSPNELMTAILKSQTDLIWFGGIGTYVKSKDENHTDASDKANDAIRINACQLSARVVGEGANLGVTQKARIEFANLDGKINADFIDNAGGVNSSDVEVNIKILLNKMTKGKKPVLTVSARNKLLESMTTDVENLVLKNSYQQAQAVSLMTFNAPTTLLGHAEYIRSLEQRNLLDRDLEFLPSDEEIEERLREGDGLNRPELSVLQCYAKNTLTKDILNSRVPDHALTEELLLAYFPDILVKKYKKDILNHQLRREIIATELANIVINRFGPTFINTIQTNTGADINTIFKAFLVVTFSFDLRNLWDKIEMLDGKVHTSIQMKALSEISRTTERQVIWLIKRMGDKIDPIKHLPIFKKAVQSLKQDLETLLPETRLARFHEIVDIYTDQKVPKDIATDMASLIPMSAIGNIFMISLQKNIPIRDMAYVYYVIGEHFQLYWLRLQSRHLFASGVWSGQALREIRGQLYVSQAKIAERYISDFKGKKVKISPKHITEWCQKEGLRTDKVLTTIEAMRGSEKIDLSMLIVAEQMLSGLYD